MKTSFILYLLLLLIDGLVTFQATGSPMLLALPFAGVLFYAALCKKPGPVAEIARLLTSALVVTMSLVNFAGNVSANFLALLTLPHFLAATQCLWELNHGQTSRDKSTPQVRLSVFSMAFYASCAAAFILLKVDDLQLAWIHQQLLAGLVVLLSLAAWECSRITTLKKAIAEDELSLGGKLRRWGIALGVGVVALLIFMAVLPPVAQLVCEASPGLKLKNPMDSDFGPPHRPGGQGERPDPLGDPNGNSSTTGETAKTGRVKLPRRVQLKLTDAPRAFLQFDEKAAGETFAAKGPLYLRSLGMVNYEEFQWRPGSEDGYWVNDEDDGRKDSRVTLEDPGPAALHYTLFVPEFDGYAVPVLAGARQFDVPKTYVLPDEWYQIRDTGNIKFGARSQQKVWGQFDAAGTEFANPGVPYVRAPEGQLGGQLKQLGDQIFQAKRRPEDVIPALLNFFKTQYVYSTKVENKNNLTPLENFLFDERKGYCDLFSTSAALLLRRAGIPARVAFGYMGGEYDLKSGLHSFKQRHAHSWVEVPLVDHGWVICEFTPNDGSNSGDGSPGAGNLPDLAAFEDANAIENKTPDADALNLQSPNFLSQLQSLLPQFSSAQLTALIGGTVMLALLWMWWRRRAAESSPEAQARRAAAARDHQPAYFREFIAMCAEFGHLRQPGETMLELLRSLKARHFFHSEFETISAYHYATRYADEPQDRVREEGFVKLIRDFKRERTKQKHL